MLVLSRNVNQTFVIKNYRLTVMKIGHDVVLLRLSYKRGKRKARRLCQFWAGLKEPFDIGKRSPAIEVQVVSIARDRVGIGFTADPKVRIDRWEIHRQKLVAKRRVRKRRGSVAVRHRRREVAQAPAAVLAR